MSYTIELDRPDRCDALLNHIHERTFRRLRELSVAQTTDGRFQISAVAHSRFVGQLTEWAVLEQVAPKDVDLSIRVRLLSSQFTEVQK